MSTQQIADKLLEYCRKGQFEQAQKELYAEDAVSLEPVGAPMERVDGLENIIRKGDAFQKMVEDFHGFEISDPLIAGDFFTVKMIMDVTLQDQPRRKEEQICLYEVCDGKIVREQFFYHQQQQ